jgi:hypothetical protein
MYESTDPFALYPNLKVDNDASHAFYLGVELARAQIAWQLKKRYVQDQELEWGVNTKPQEQTSKTAHREASIKESKEVSKKA